jgi:molybdopterin converting factor small subunit
MSLGEKVAVEFLGMPRRQAECAELHVAAGRIRDILEAVERSCPGLAGLIGSDGRLAAHYLVSLDGRRFVTDLNEQLQAGDRLLLLSADAGG